MSGFKHLLPSSTFRAAVCVSVAVGTSLSGLGDEVVGCLAGLARVPAGVAVTNRFVPFRPDFASIFAVQMDGGTNRLDSDVVAWCPVGGEPVAFWKLELPGMAKCPKCGEYVLSHRVCRNCGSYGGKVVLQVKDKQD